MSTATFLMSSAAATGTGAAGPMGFLIGILPWLLIFVIFYMLMIRPQQKRAREHQAQIAALKKGDQVVTAGGIRGRITRVMDDEAEVEIASGIRVIVIKGTLSQVITAAKKPAND